MKKYIFICLAFVTVFATSCTKTQQVTPNQTILTSVSAGSWFTTDGGRTFSTNISMPEIDSYANHYNGVLVYITFDNVTYEAVPEVYGGIAYSFSHSVGQLHIDIQASNGTSAITPPGSLGVKIVLIPSS